MKQYQLSNMKGGWFIGDFEPTMLRTQAFEAACKQYRAGDSEPRHIHRVGTEITLIVTGRVIMHGKTYSTGDVVVLEPGESSDFHVLKDTVTVVLKMPSVPGDKYLVE
jgi:hypothetical protein